MTRTFSPCSDLQTQIFTWAMYLNGAFVGTSDIVSIAGSYAKKYRKDVKCEDWRKAHHAIYTAK